MTRPATRPPFTFTIAPGRFDASSTAVISARLTAARNSDAILGTEATRNPFAVPGWQVSQGDGKQGETYVAVDPSRFKRLASGVEQITSGGGTGRFKSPTYVAWMVCLDLLTGVVVIFIAPHLRAHNFKGSKRYKPGNIVAWWEGVRGIKRLRRKLRHRWPTAVMVVAGDPNATRRNYFTRAVRKTFPHASLGWGGPFSSSLLWGLRVLSVHTVNPGAASDHPWKRLTVAYRAGVVAVGGGRRE